VGSVLVSVWPDLRPCHVVVLFLDVAHGAVDECAAARRYPPNSDEKAHFDELSQGEEGERRREISRPFSFIN